MLFTVFYACFIVMIQIKLFHGIVNDCIHIFMKPLFLGLPALKMDQAWLTLHNLLPTKVDVLDISDYCYKVQCLSINSTRLKRGKIVN